MAVLAAALGMPDLEIPDLLADANADPVIALC